MPNPNFSGNVPHKRCETCKFWYRAPQNPTAAFGCCTNVRNLPRGVETPAGTALCTTDLSVCSNWTDNRDDNA